MKKALLLVAGAAVLTVMATGCSWCCEKMGCGKTDAKACCSADGKACSDAKACGETKACEATSAAAEATK